MSIKELYGYIIKRLPKNAAVTFEYVSSVFDEGIVIKSDPHNTKEKQHISVSKSWGYVKVSVGDTKDTLLNLEVNYKALSNARVRTLVSDFINNNVVLTK